MKASKLGTLALALEYGIKVAAVGIVPENRQPSSSSAWLLLILLLPGVGLPLFLLLGSPHVRGRRHRIQAEAIRAIKSGLEELPDSPDRDEIAPGLANLFSLNRHLTGLPATTGVNHGIESDYEKSIRRMADAIDGAERDVHVEIYAMAWDRTTDVFFEALVRAAARGVSVRVLLDHLGSRKYPGFAEMQSRLTAAGIHWYLLMPIKPLERRWRRPDLRNHRKLIVIDDARAFMGSQNMIESAYLSRRNQRIGRHWHDVTIELSGSIVASLAAVFHTDWYTESGERLDFGRRPVEEPDVAIDGRTNVFQLVPSGPGLETEPTLRLFTALIYRAQRRLVIVSPYFVPDEALLTAITTAAYRGVSVELYVSEQADQFVVDRAQASYYSVLFDAGVRIFRLPKPAVLHSKFFTVDDEVAVFGSSNMDLRSFYLDYEISLMGTGGDFVASVLDVVAEYREVCTELTPETWERRPMHLKFVENAMKLTSALQ